MMNLYNGEENNRTFETVFSQFLTVPGVLIHRDVFLRKELRRYCTESLVDKAIEYSPIKAGVKREVIQEITTKIIRYESSKAALLAFATGVPDFGPFFADLGTIAVDIIAYTALVLRVVQQFAYLYGYEEEIDFDRENADAETMNRMLLFTIIMAGCQGASSVFQELMRSLSESVLKTLPEKPLTKGLIYPVVKQVLRYFGIKLNKKLYAKGISMMIPVVGGLLSGGLTFFIFRGQCRRLRRLFQKYAFNSFET